MFKQQVILINKHNHVILNNYNGSMPIGIRTNVGLMAIKVARGEKQTIENGNTVVVWQNKQGKIRAYSQKHAWYKAVNHIYISEFIRSILNKKATATQNGRVLNHPANQSFLEASNLRDASIALIKHWEHKLNEHIKFRDLEKSISLQ